MIESKNVAIDELIDRFPIPSLPFYNKRFNTLVANEQFDGIIKLVKCSPVLATQLLRISSSPFYRQHTDNPATSIKQCVERVGLTGISGISTLHAFRQKSIQLYDIDARHKLQLAFLEYSTRSAQLAAIICKSFDLDHEIGHTLGLMMHVGEILIQHSNPPALLNDMYCTPINQRLEWQRENLGFTQHEISAAAFNHWHIAPIFKDTAQNLQTPDTATDPQARRYARAVKLAIEITHRTPQCPDHWFDMSPDWPPGAPLDRIADWIIDSENQYLTLAQNLYIA